MKEKDMAISLKIQTRVVMITLTLMIAAVAVQAQSGRSTVRGVVADESAAREGKFVVVIGATVELNRGPSKLSATTDDKGMYSFGRIPYGDYTLSVLAPGYRPYTLKFFAGSDARVSIAVLLLKE
jgi:hypothetical protein